MRDLAEDLSAWTPPPAPGPDRIDGRYVRLERLAPTHAAALHDAFRGADSVWDYMPYGPFAKSDDYAGWVAGMAGQADPFFYALVNPQSGRAEGVASYLRIAPAQGTIEIGHIALAPVLQRTRAATEALTLMIGWAFEAGYRRLEWKCNAQNLPSRRAAERLGLSYEGIFRQAAVIKGRNRDTAWFAAIDKEWPALRHAYATWLAAENFDAAGRQRRALADLTRPILVTRDPLMTA